MESRAGRLGQSIVIKGHVTASEDLTITGHVEGTIDLHDHVLTIADTAHISAQVSAATIRVMGTVTGNILASGTVDLGGTASVKGDITASQVAVSEGAAVHGRLDVPRSKTTTTPVGKTKPLAAAV